jgi:hypothetical protein
MSTGIVKMEVELNDGTRKPVELRQLTLSTSPCGLAILDLIHRVAF